MKQRDKKEKAATEAASSSGPNCSRLEDELQQTRCRLARIQEEAERQRDRQQREITSLRADKHRLEEKVLEQSRLNAERSLLEQSQRHTEEQMRSARKCFGKYHNTFTFVIFLKDDGGESQYKAKLQYCPCTTSHFQELGEAF